MVKTDDALKIIENLTRTDPELEEMVREASLNAVVAQLIYEARTGAGLTRQELADRIGTKQSAIARLEDADYEGHSLSMLQKIARVLDSDANRARTNFGRVMRFISCDRMDVCSLFQVLSIWSQIVE
jgi:ribosome-binding protein aMBF1 (putative translation factor)